jgi:hypothetical protein
MANIRTYFIDDIADCAADEPVSLWTRAFVVAGLSLAAWVPVLVPLYLIFYR